MTRPLRPPALALMATLAGVAPASAQDNTLRTPSGNIGCFAYDEAGAATVRCDILQVRTRSLRRPKGCDLDFGQAFVIAGGARRGAAICHGDTVIDPHARASPYGETWRWRGLACLSSPAGLRCANTRGAGFEISRERQSVF